MVLPAEMTARLLESNSGVTALLYSSYQNQMVFCSRASPGRFSSRDAMSRP